MSADNAGPVYLVQFVTLEKTSCKYFLRQLFGKDLDDTGKMMKTDQDANSEKKKKCLIMKEEKNCDNNMNYCTKFSLSYGKVDHIRVARSRLAAIVSFSTSTLLH